MPIYSFENKKTGVQYNLNLSMSERETYIKEHPEVEQIFTSLNIGDPVSLGVTKPDLAFRQDIMGKVKEAHPRGNNLERRYVVPRGV